MLPDGLHHGQASDIITAMTIKKSVKTSDSVAEMAPVTGGATIADRFKLDIPEAQPVKSSSGAGTMITFLAALAALAVAGLLTYMLYDHWEFLKDA